MGVKAGIVLSVFGILFALGMVTLNSVVLPALLSRPTSPVAALLAPLALGIALIFGFGAFLLSSIFYLLAHITSRGHRSKALGILFIVGGLIILTATAIAMAVILPLYRGPLIELIPFIAFFTVQAAVGLLITVAGIRKMGRV